MVVLHTLSAAGGDTEEALAGLSAQLGRIRPEAGFAVVLYGCGHDDDAIGAFMRETLPGTPYLGGTSSAGLICTGTLLEGRAIGLLLVEDAEGRYGVAAAPFGDDPAAAARTALLQALNQAGCPGELPELVWIYQSPGQEEAVIEGLRGVLGDSCPIVGGSAADDTVAGEWRQLTAAGAMADGLAIAVLFPSGGVGCAFQSGYHPTGISGVVTRTTGGGASREILEIDGAPAGPVYDGWIGGKLHEQAIRGGTILARTTMHPLAVEVGAIENIPQYLLIHPEAMGADGSLRTFVAVSPGTRLHLMQGEERQLIDRAGNVAREAASRLPHGAQSLAGGLMVYCAGCMMAVGPRMPEVAGNVAAGFDGHPFIGTFTFGEQGQMVGRNVHGNLMISAVAFGR